MESLTAEISTGGNRILLKLWGNTAHVLTRAEAETVIAQLRDAIARLPKGEADHA